VIADCPNVSQFIMQYFEGRTTDLDARFKSIFGVDVKFTLQQPPHITLLGPIQVDAESPFYENTRMLSLFTRLRAILAEENWSMPLHRTKSRDTASPGYKFLDPNCFWYVANLYFQDEEERQRYALFLTSLEDSLEEFEFVSGKVKIVETSTHVHYFDSSEVNLLSIPLYQKAEQFRPHISMYKIDWNDISKETRQHYVDEIYHTIGLIPGGLPLDYTIAESNLKLSVKTGHGFLPLTEEASAMSKWICSNCKWVNNAQNTICGGSQWKKMAGGRPKPCGKPKN
jgi:hypothetical protein